MVMDAQVAFVMPSKYRKVEDLPKPGNANVVIKETPAQMLAAISWRYAASGIAMHQQSAACCVEMNLTVWSALERCIARCRTPACCLSRLQSFCMLQQGRCVGNYCRGLE